MKMLVGALLAVTALSPTLASAQGIRLDAAAQVGRDDRDPRGDWQDGARDDRAGRPDRGDRIDRRQVARDRFDGRGPEAQRPSAPGDGRPDRQGVDRRPDQRWADRGDGRGVDRADDRRSATGRRAANDWTRDRFDARDDRRTEGRFADRAAWNRGWRGDDRYDWSDYRTAHRGAYRLPRYYAPGGGGYRRVAIGVGLQASLWNRNYWIADPYAYRLPEAYGPYRWVRYYDDALLVDLNSGRVVDAVYGIFW